MYAQYFGLREPAFSVTPDPRFFYSNPAYEEAYANLVYGISARKGFVMLSGEVGTGKTTLLRRLMENLEPNAAFVFVFNSRLTFDEMLSFVCDELELAPAGNERLRKIQALNEFLLVQLRRGGTTALLIDEAQDLGDDILEDFRLLSNLETCGEKLLQIVLVGQPEIEVKLARPELRQLRQRITLRCRLDRLKMREVGGFIEHRLRVAGYQGRPLFTAEAVTAVARLSRGIPRIVNVICDNALLIAYGMSRRQVDEAIVAEVAGDLELASAGAQAGIPAGGIDHALKQLEAGVRTRGVRTAQPSPRRKPLPDDHPRPVRTDLRTLGWAALLMMLLGLGGGAIAAFRSGIEARALGQILDEIWERAAPAARAPRATPPLGPATLPSDAPPAAAVPDAIVAVPLPVSLDAVAADLAPAAAAAADRPGGSIEEPVAPPPRVEARPRSGRKPAPSSRDRSTVSVRTSAATAETPGRSRVSDTAERSIEAERVRLARPFPAPFANGARCITQPSTWFSSSWRDSSGAQTRAQP